MQYITLTNHKEYKFNYEHKRITDGKKEIDYYRVWRGKLDLRGNNLDKLIAKLEEKFGK